MLFSFVHGFKLFDRGFEYYPAKYFSGSLALERDLAGVVWFLICVKWYQSFDYFPAMTRDDESQRLFAGMGTVEKRIVRSKTMATQTLEGGE